jgi:hypothetical protein
VSLPLNQISVLSLFLVSWIRSHHHLYTRYERYDVMTRFLEIGSGNSSILCREVILSALSNPTSWIRKATQIKWVLFAAHNCTTNVLNLTWIQNERCAKQKYSNNLFNASFFRMMSILNFISSNGTLYTPSIMFEVPLH